MPSSYTHTQSYQNYKLHFQNPGTPIVPSGPEFDNCKVLDDTLQLSWRVDIDTSQVRFQLCGCTAR